MAKAAKKTVKKKIATKIIDEKKPDAKTAAAGGFPKIVTEAKIQAVSYDVTSGSNVKFKDIKFTSGQHEKLVAIAQDSTARVRLIIEEINPPFDAAAAKGTPQQTPRFTDLSDKNTDGKNGKDATDDGSQLPIQ